MASPEGVVGPGAGQLVPKGSSPRTGLREEDLGLGNVTPEESLT